jgi:hypothetical protein
MVVKSQSMVKIAPGREQGTYNKIISRFRLEGRSYSLIILQSCNPYHIWYGLQDYYFHIWLKTLGEVGAVSQLIASMVIIHWTFNFSATRGPFSEFHPKTKLGNTSCVGSLNHLGALYYISLYWVSAHQNIKGNEKVKNTFYIFSGWSVTDAGENWSSWRVFLAKKIYNHRSVYDPKQITVPMRVSSLWHAHPKSQHVDQGSVNTEIYLYC